MGRRSEVGLFYSARNNIDPDGNSKRRPKSYASTAPTHFVPSFAVRRPVVKTEEMEQFLSEAPAELPRGFEVSEIGNMAMTLIGQRRMIHMFRTAEAPEVDPDKIKRLAENLQEELGLSLKGKPRCINVPVGRVFRFGHHNTSLGAVPTGWKGYSARYARRAANPERDWLPMPMVVRETNLALGGITSAFSDEEFGKNVRTSGLATTPHISFAKRKSGGISEAEAHSLAGPIEEILPDTITVFDPVIYLTLSQSQESPTLLFPRSPGKYINDNRVAL